MEPLNLSLAVETLRVTIKDKDGSEKQYELREMIAAEREKYLEQSRANLELSADGTRVIQIKKLEGFQAALISRCLFDDSSKLVPITEIQQWPASVTEKLFKAAQHINRLDAAEEKESPKNV